MSQELDDNSLPASKELGAIFSVFRKLFNLRQDQLAEILGVGRRQVIGNIEVGKSNISVAVIFRFLTIVEYINKNANKFNFNFMQRENLRLIEIQLADYIADIEVNFCETAENCLFTNSA